MFRKNLKNLKIQTWLLN